MYDVKSDNVNCFIQHRPTTTPRRRSPRWRALPACVAAVRTPAPRHSHPPPRRRLTFSACLWRGAVVAPLHCRWAAARASRARKSFAWPNERPPRAPPRCLRSRPTPARRRPLRPPRRRPPERISQRAATTQCAPQHSPSRHYPPPPRPRPPCRRPLRTATPSWRACHRGAPSSPGAPP